MEIVKISREQIDDLDLPVGVSEVYYLKWFISFSIITNALFNEFI